MTSSEPTISQLYEKLEELRIITLIGVKTDLLLEEAALYTGLSVSYLYTLTSKKLIPHYKQARKLYFNKSELDRWLESRGGITTDADIDSRAATYIATNKL